jgi:L-ribulose-5-phosphate 4-epimerase
MLQELKEQVCDANLRLVKEGLVTLTWGNASAIDRNENLVVIKPSGVPYAEMKPEHMVVVSLKTGEVMEGKLRPSTDTPTHCELYKAFTGIGGIAHSHSLHATAWAQARKEILALGTTHADHFNGPIPCTRVMKKKEIERDYELNTGRVIIERFSKLNPLEMPAVLVANHAPFAWGVTVDEAVKNAMVLEQIARMAIETLRVNPKSQSMSDVLLQKHFQRKHGPQSYYGQPNNPKK